MEATAIPGILGKWWFWLAIMPAFLAVLYCARRKYPASFVRFGASLAKHQKAIAGVANVIIVFSVVLFLGLWLSIPVRAALEAWSEPEPMRTMELRSTWSSGLLLMAVWSGQASLFLGWLSPFHSNLTRRKRVILLTLCLLPIGFTAVVLAGDSTGDRRSTIQLCALASWPGWVMNAPAILLGQHFADFVRRIFCKLRSVPTDVSS
jgi:hypothetical protein